LTGKTCQMWSQQSPHSHSFTSASYPSEDLRENYCRNPDKESDGPWCYTTDPDQRWEYCLPACLECYNKPHGVDYRGGESVTLSGKQCQKWTEQEPHSHSFTPDNYPSGDLRENFCRNPDNAEGPWCYTTDPDKRWEYCLHTCKGFPKVFTWLIGSSDKAPVTKPDVIGNNYGGFGVY